MGGAGGEAGTTGSLDEAVGQLRGAATLRSARALLARRAPRRAPSARGGPRLTVDRALLERRLGQTLRALRLQPRAGLAARLLTAEALRCADELVDVEPGEPAAPSAAPTPAEAEGLAELRGARSPLYACAVLAHLAGGGAPADVRGALARRPRSVLAPAPAAEADDDLVEGLRFDLARNTWIAERVARDPSWHFHLRLAQFLDWELPGFFVARDELQARICAAARDPHTGAALVAPERVTALVADLADAATLHDHGLPCPLDLALDLQFSSTAGGDRPSRVSWHMEPHLLGALAALLDDGEGARALAAVAGRARSEALREREPKRRALASLFERCRGVPVRHRRGHWALVNLANVGRTVAEMGREGDILPRSRTVLDPASLRSRHAHDVRLKLRFVLNDFLEINVLSDDDYWKVLALHGFPPNHETVSRTRPILAAGYLTVTRGRVVALEDDGVMVPGKMPAGLPPMQDVLLALGFDVDLAEVSAAGLVVDWARFADVAAGLAPAPEVPADLDPVGARALFTAASHADRPALVVAATRRWLEAAARERPDVTNAARLLLVTRQLAEALRGYRLINTGGRAVALGELPKDAEWVDESVAGHLVYKVVRR